MARAKQAVPFVTDAFRFVAQAFASGLAQAVADRGGVPSVWHQPPSGSSPGELTVDLVVQP